MQVRREFYFYLKSVMTFHMEIRRLYQVVRVHITRPKENYTNTYNNIDLKWGGTTAIAGRPESADCQVGC